MSEVAIRQNGAVAVPGDDTYARLAVWAESAQAAHEVATKLVQTSFVPEAFRGKAMEATGAILAGAEVGLSPMAALRAFDIINGTAAPRAVTLRAVVQSRGHEIRLVESTATRAIVEGRRRGEDAWQRSVWNIERAKGLGLVNKHNWKAQPGAMLVARATAECARLVASDAILGIPYASEELDDGDLIGTPVVATAEVKPTKRAQRKALPAAEPIVETEPEFDDEPAADGPAPISQPQQRKMHALLREHGLEEREAGLAYISQVVGREVESSKDLSVLEAGAVIDALEGAEPTSADDWPPTPEIPS